VRISDLLISRVTAAIEALPVLSVVRQAIDWEIAPALMPRPGGGLVLAYMVAVSLPVGSLNGDKVLYMAPLDDPDASQEKVSALIRSLYDKCQAEADERQAAVRTAANGHRQHP
jgi:hypothetical protein